jgi:hypothetical protein
MALISRLCICVTLAILNASAQQPTKETLSIQNPRPVAELVSNLEERYGTAINYEDPPYQFNGDLEDVAQKVRKERKEIPLLIPREGSIDFETMKDQKHNAVSLEAAITETLRRYADQTGMIFSVRRNGNTLSVVPGNFRDKRGEFRSYGAIFDRKITIVPKRRRGLEYLDDVCQALSRETGSRVVTATIPYNLFAAVSIDKGVQTLPAREALALLFGSTGRNLSWQLLYDADDRTYFLNIRTVPKADAAGLATGDKSSYH